MQFQIGDRVQAVVEGVTYEGTFQQLGEGTYFLPGGKTEPVATLLQDNGVYFSAPLSAFTLVETSKI